ncbi:MAG: hypothetical protein WB689_19640, partial [Xanthobacteraceae bacterium]
MASRTLRHCGETVKKISKPTRAEYHPIQEWWRLSRRKIFADSVRFESKAEVTLLNFDVRFTPESG